MLSDLELLDCIFDKKKRCLVFQARKKTDMAICTACQMKELVEAIRHLTEEKKW